MFKTPFYTALEAEVTRLGGLHNAHLHLDRANTLGDGYVDHGALQVLENSHISLQKKHALLATVHEGPAYDRDDMLARVADTTGVMIEVGTHTADTMVDVTADRVGLTALTWLQDYSRTVADKITIRCASYTPLGFNDAHPERWDIFERGVAQADFIGSLPEADDREDYPDNIGFEEHCRRVLALAQAQNKMIHVHTDQRNEPSEAGTERLIEVIRETGPVGDPTAEPLVWAVHMISPSTYEDKRWDAFVEGMVDTNVGVISCPSAAIGMRQLRPISTPTYNAIPRILELAIAGVPIRLGSDNVCDMCSPSTTANLYEEVFTLSAAIRFFKVEILAKFAAGIPLSMDEREELAEHLKKNDEEIDKVVARARKRGL